jgi:MFS transporter, FSR family, fosmidomycin resistance protein
MTQPDRNHTARTLLLTGVLHAFTHLYQVALMPLYLLIQKDFGFQSVSQATVLLTVMLVSCYIPSYHVGVLADRMSRKHLLGFGLALNGLGFAALGVAPSFGWALGAVVVAGVGGSFYHPAATAMLARMFPRNTGKVLGLVGIGASAGFFLGPLYTGWRAGTLSPVLGAAAWRRPVIELGVLGLIVAGLFAWLAQPDQPAAAEERKPVHSGKMFPTAALWFFFLAYCFAFSLRDFAGASMGTLGSLFLQNVHGFTPERTGLALSMIFIAASISNPLFGSLSDGGRKRWIAVAIVIAAGTVALFPHVPSRWTIPVFIVYGFFFLAGYPMTEAAIMEAVPDAVRGRALGLFVMAGGIIGNLAHWVMGAWLKALGPAAHSASSYFLIYAALAGLVLSSLLGLACLHAIQKREVISSGTEPKSKPLVT